MVHDPDRGTADPTVGETGDVGGRTPFSTTHSDEIRVETLPERPVAVARHDGPLATIDETRRPLYQHLIMNELVAGPPMIRFPEGWQEDGDPVDVLVGTTAGFHGDETATVAYVAQGEYALLDYEGPEEGLPAARQELRDWVTRQGRRPGGPMLQVHIMDPIDGETEQQLQLPLD